MTEIYTECSMKAASMDSVFKSVYHLYMCKFNMKCVELLYLESLMMLWLSIRTSTSVDLEIFHNSDFPKDYFFSKDKVKGKYYSVFE